ncbi:MAG: right-handed parallel beta-helix repeat-containing protein [Candidatus Brocadiia bacterium]
MRPSKDKGKAIGKSLATGEEHRGDILEVLQKLSDALDVEAGGPGGRIMIADGVYVTAGDDCVELRSGVHIAAARRHGATLKLADGGAVRRKSGWFFSGRRVRNVVVDGIVFDGNREAQTVSTRLTRDAAAGDAELHVADASKFAGRKRQLGIGRKKKWNTPGGFQVRDQNGQERAKASEVDADANVIKLLFPLRKSYSADAEAEAVFYPRIGAVTINGGNYAIRNCMCINTQESPVLFVSGGADQPGPKVLEDNIVTDHRGGACVRLQRGTCGGVLRGNVVEGGIAWYQRFWGEAIALEGNHHSICQGNIIKGPADRLIRANDAHHCVVANNVVWVPLATFDAFDDIGGWEPLRGDETLQAQAEEKRQGKAALRVAAGTRDGPGVRCRSLDETRRDWTPYNRAHLWVKAQHSALPLHLRLADGAGNFQDFRTHTWVGGEWEIATLDLTDPVASEGTLDRRDVREVQLTCQTDADGLVFAVDHLRLGQRTGWGITVWGASHTVVADNTFYGVGSPAGTIYYGSGGWSASSQLTISGNTLAFCYDGIGWARQAERRIVVDGNVLYATMGGIRGDVVATGNLIAYDPSNARTTCSIDASVASANFLYKTRGIRAAGSPAPNITGNTLVDTLGPGILSEENQGALIASNVLQSRIQAEPAVRLLESASHNRIAGNWIQGGAAAFDIRGSDSVISDNFAKEAGPEPILARGARNTFRDNHGAPVAQGRLTLASGAQPAGRLRAVATDEARPPVVRSIRPVPETTPDAPYAFDAYPQWDPQAGCWDVVVEWKRDPGADLDAVVVVDQ